MNRDNQIRRITQNQEHKLIQEDELIFQHKPRYSDVLSGPIREDNPELINLPQANSRLKAENTQLRTENAQLKEQIRTLESTSAKTFRRQNSTRVRKLPKLQASHSIEAELALPRDFSQSVNSIVDYIDRAQFETVAEERDKLVSIAMSKASKLLASLNLPLLAKRIDEIKHNAFLQNENWIDEIFGDDSNFHTFLEVFEQGFLIELGIEQQKVRAIIEEARRFRQVAHQRARDITGKDVINRIKLLKADLDAASSKGHAYSRKWRNLKKASLSIGAAANALPGPLLGMMLSPIFSAASVVLHAASLFVDLDE